VQLTYSKRISKPQTDRSTKQ